MISAFKFCDSFIADMYALRSPTSPSHQSIYFLLSQRLYSSFILILYNRSVMKAGVLDRDPVFILVQLASELARSSQALRDT